MGKLNVMLRLASLGFAFVTPTCALRAFTRTRHKGVTIPNGSSHTTTIQKRYAAMSKTKACIVAVTTVCVNFGLMIWHLQLVRDLGLAAAAGYATMTMLPVIVGSLFFLGVLLLWTRLYRIAGWLLVALFAIGLVVGGNEHFISAGPFNVFAMSPNRWMLPFAISSVLLAAVEIVGLWSTFRVATLKPSFG